MRACRSVRVPTRPRSVTVAALGIATGPRGPSPPARAGSGGPRLPGPVRLQHRRRLPPRQLPAARRLLAEARRESGSDEAGRTSARPRRAATSSWPSSPSPENHKKLDRYQEIARRAGAGRGPHRRPGARRWRREGKAVVWIDGGLHATEVLGAQQLIETIYQLVSRDRRGDAAHPRRRDHPVRRTPTRTAWTWSPTGTCATRTRSSARIGGLPRLYQKYIGHDNNRDFYMPTPGRDGEHEPRAVPRVVPADRLQPPPDRPGRHGAVLRRRSAIRSTTTSIRWSSAASTRSARRCTQRFVAEGKPGATMRSRRAATRRGGTAACAPPAYFHNMIGLLTETIGSPTPMRDPVRAGACSCRAATCRVPIAPQDVALPPVDRLLGDRQQGGPRLASRHREHVPLQHLADGQERHRARQHATRWTVDAADGCERVAPSAAGERDSAPVAGGGDGRPRQRACRRRMPAAPRPGRSATRAATSCPPISPTSSTATKFVNTLIETGVKVHRATARVHRRRQDLPGRLATS